MTIQERIQAAFEAQARDRRGFDKYILAPFLIYLGITQKRLSKWNRRALVTAGIFQLIYAWGDYKKLQADLNKFITEKGKFNG